MGCFVYILGNKRNYLQTLSHKEWVILHAYFLYFPEINAMGLRGLYLGLGVCISKTNHAVKTLHPLRVTAKSAEMFKISAEIALLKAISDPTGAK